MQKEAWMMATETLNSEDLSLLQALWPLQSPVCEKMVEKRLVSFDKINLLLFPFS